jgi:perosamine synthetase
MSSELPAILGGTPLRPDGPPGWPRPLPDVLQVLAQSMRDGSWGHYEGPHGDHLRARLAELHGVDHAWLCSSGTAAVELALRGVGVQPGDEVILAAYDFKANFQDVLTIGAVPVLVDINAAGQLDTDQLDAARSPQTKAVLASHLHGAMVDMPAVRAWADEHKLAVVEDVCQMPGARIGGRVAGTWGDAGVLSFGGSKVLTAGRRCSNGSGDSSCGGTTSPLSPNCRPLSCCRRSIGWSKTTTGVPGLSHCCGNG